VVVLGGLVFLMSEVPLLVDLKVATCIAQGGWTPLHLAAFNGHAGVADALLAAGSDPGTPLSLSLSLSIYIYIHLYIYVYIYTCI